MTAKETPAEQSRPATHLAVLRCQTWHTWPEQAAFDAGQFALDIGSEAPLPTKLVVVTYLNRTEPAKYEAEKTDFGSLLWTGVVPGLYTVRDVVMKAPEDTVQLKFETEHSRRGEVDLCLAFSHDDDLSAPAIEVIRSTLFALMSLLNLQLKDFLTPVAPIQIFKLGPQNRTFEAGVVMAVRTRRQLQPDALGTSVKELAGLLFRSTNAEKLRTALELYGSHFHERQARTRFLLLVIAMEVLAVPSKKHNVAQKLLDRWQAELLDEMKAYPETSAEYASLDALARELIHRREDSIRSQIRKLFRSVAEAKGENPGPWERRALRVYDTRSTLVHDGSVRPEILSNTEAEARELLEQLLSVHLNAASKH